MNLEEIRYYCIQKKGATESFPFNDTALVFKVAGKMFALLDLTKERGISLKALPEKSVLLREQYDFIIPGYHMNKKHWNTILINESTDSELICKLVDDSYAIVFSKLTKKEKLLLE